MVTRRKLILSGAAGLLAATLPRAGLAAPDDPVGVVTAIYTRAAKGKGDGGGGFVIENKAAKAKYLSKSLVALWTKADARTPKGDVGPIDFDPVTNSQDPDVKSFKVVAEKQEADKATVAATIDSHQREARAKAADKTIRYDFVHEAGQWKIDEIRGAVDGSPWSVRALLVNSLKH
jgi:3-oxoacyl-[acyl-carrier-protein] synthase III